MFPSGAAGGRGRGARTEVPTIVGRVKILIVDDHPLIREGLQNVLRELDDGFDVIAATCGDEAVEILRQHEAVTLILLDLMLPGTEGFNLLHQVREERPDVPIVVLSANDSPGTVREAIDIGAMGFISKRSSTPVLVSALQLVLAGAVYIPPEALAAGAPRARNAMSIGGQTPTNGAAVTGLSDLGLTERQRQVLALLIQGKPNKIICRELGLAEGTIKTHIAAILRALNVSSRTQAIYSLSRLGVRFPFIARNDRDRTSDANT